MQHLVIKNSHCLIFAQKCPVKAMDKLVCIYFYFHSSLNSFECSTHIVLKNSPFMREMHDAMVCFLILGKLTTLNYCRHIQHKVSRCCTPETLIIGNDLLLWRGPAIRIFLYYDCQQKMFQCRGFLRSI